MQVHNSITSLRIALADAGRIAFAPTMGNLHDGHISLMQQARQLGNPAADTVVSSIFVNRLQFGPRDDFDTYPRTFQEDCDKLVAAGVDYLFAPNEQALYPSPQEYFVQPAQTQDSTLEGASRPGHFRGVTTVVTKLFNIVQPDIALFGKKDYQQLMVIRNMVRELNMPIDVIGCETVRATDGLALSSRNGYLTPAERAEASRLSAILRQIVAAITAGENNFAKLEQTAVAELAAHGWQPDYVAVRRQTDLQKPLGEPDEALVVLATARLGSTRLIDNMEVAQQHG